MWCINIMSHCQLSNPNTFSIIYLFCSCSTCFAKKYSFETLSNRCCFVSWDATYTVAKHGVTCLEWHAVKLYTHAKENLSIWGSRWKRKIFVTSLQLAVGPSQAYLLLSSVNVWMQKCMILLNISIVWYTINIILIFHGE